MVTYMTQPKNRVTVSATNYDNRFDSCVVTRFENGFDQATLTVRDVAAAYRSNLAAGSTVAIQVKDEGGAYETLLAGIIRFVSEGVNPETITLQCDQIGFGLAECLVSQEYGTESNNPTLDTIAEILTDAGAGIIDKWVEKVLNTAVNSQYAYDTSKVEAIAGTIPYVYFPYKPASKCLADLCNIVTSLKAGAAGPHWIVTTAAGTNYLRVKEITGTQVGWTKYYGDSQANATLVQGTDFEQFTPQTMVSEANYVLYHSKWIWPSNSDYITETVDIGEWDGTNVTMAYDTDAGDYKINSKSVKATVNSQQVSEWWMYPDDEATISLDLTKAGGKYNIPTCSFWAKRNATLSLGASPDWFSVWFSTNWAGSVVYEADIDLTKFLPSEDTWYYIQFPIGQYWRTPTLADNSPFRGIYEAGGGGDWTDINTIRFGLINKPVDSEFYIDGFNLTGWALRAAYNSTKIAAEGLKTRFFNDQFGKGDTLNASDDSGTIAQLAYGELLRLQSSPTVGTLHCQRMIKDILAGQWVHIHAKKNSGGTYQIDGDFRVTQVRQIIDAKGYQTELEVTNDLTNSYPRTALDSQAAIAKAQRPEFQDRQATGIKMRDIDITQPILAVDYG